MIQEKLEQIRPISSQLKISEFLLAMKKNDQIVDIRLENEIIKIRAAFKKLTLLKKKFENFPSSIKSRVIVEFLKKFRKVFHYQNKSMNLQTDDQKDYQKGLSKRIIKKILKSGFSILDLGFLTS